LVYFVAVWYFMVIWYNFSYFGMLHQEKSGNPAPVPSAAGDEDDPHPRHAAMPPPTVVAKSRQLKN
jgi:hypothetical protein